MVLFQHQRKSSLSSQGKPLKELTRILNVTLFLSDEKRQTLLKKIRELTGLESARYESLCSILIDNLVHYAQNLPETRNSYYSHPGGVVDYALNRTEAALELFQEFIVQAQPDTLSEEQKLWQYALYSAAILKGIGKLFIDYKVTFYDAKGQFLKEWNPLLESMSGTGIYYFFEFEKESDVEFRRRLNLLMAKTLMPASGYAWLASNSDVLAVWLALLNEDEASAGTLGALLIRADALAIQRYMLEFMNKTVAVHGSGRYRAGTFAGGQPETLLEKEQAIGMEFIQWMIKALDKGILMINKAPLYMVPGGLLMCPEIFQLFVREHPEYKNWQAVQNGFLSLDLHEYGLDGGVMSRFEQIKDHSMQSGIVFSEYQLALPEVVQVAQITGEKVESLSMSATELIHKAQFSSAFIQQQNVALAEALYKLNAAGHWVALEQQENALSPGVKKGG
jgi:integrating conjugative element relaxase (TIGR03760 family)